LLSPDEEEGAASFLQVQQQMSVQNQRHKHSLHLLQGATTPALAFLAISSHTKHGRADPFGKVKAMVRDMLRKLEETHAAEAKKNEWCESEMGKTTKSQHDKQEWVSKLKDRIGAMDAEIEQLTSDIKTTNADLAEMNEAVSEATKVREAENTRAIAAIQQYKDAQSLIKTALSVLKKFYEKSAGAPAGGAKKKEGLGGGIIGILEIAIQDFSDLQEETEQAEATGGQQFKELMQESQVKSAVFSKDLEYRNRNKVKLEGDKMHADSDLKNYQKELAAVEQYLDKLKASCIAKPDSYEERKARREKELASLKEALQYLNGQGMA